VRHARPGSFFAAMMYQDVFCVFHGIKPAIRLRF